MLKEKLASDNLFYNQLTGPMSAFKSWRLTFGEILKRMRWFLLLFFWLISTRLLLSQDFVLLSVGEGYANQSYYSFQENKETIVVNEAWDLAFCSNGSGILLNESSKSTFLEPSKELRLFLAPSTNFSDPINSDNLQNRLWNDEKSWVLGAFNTPKNPDDPNDFGWGIADGNGKILGNRVFVLQLRNGNFLKLKFDSDQNGLGTEFTIRYANLDGTNEKTATVSWADFSPPMPLKYFSFTTEKEVTVIPQNWDLVFQRYVTPLDNGQGGILDYSVTGGLGNQGIQIAQATQVNTQTVDYQRYRDSLQTEIDVIGYDWKSFDFNNTNEWTVYTDRAYFLKDLSGMIWKIVFIDFEGAPTGNIVLQRWKVGPISSSQEVQKNSSPIHIFPNPADTEFDVLFDWILADEKAVISIFDVIGRAIWQKNIAVKNGLNDFKFSDLQLPEGMYQLMLQTGSHRFSKPIFITR